MLHGLRFSVKNVGTLAAKYNFALNIASKNSLNGHDLSEVIQVAVVNGGFTGGRTEAQALTGYTSLASFNKSGTLAANTGSDTYGVVLYWIPTDHDNDYNVNNGQKTSDNKDALTIEFGITVNATQLTSESDSFDNKYDIGVPWLGGRDDAGLAANTDSTAKTVKIESADQLASFAAAVNGGNSYAGYTVTLDKDIDLGNVAWTPMGNPENMTTTSFSGTFDGQNHTIYNLKSTDKVSAGLFGSLFGTVQNVKVENAAITSSHYAGVICAWSTGTNIRVLNCSVKNATVITAPELVGSGYDNGDKAGAIVGYVAAGDKVDGCKAENVTVQGYRDIGGIAGYANAGSTVTNNTANNITLINDREHNYKGYTTDAQFDVNDVIGEQSSSATVSGNTATDVTKSVMYVDGLAVSGTGDTKTYTVSKPAGFAKLFDTGILVKNSTVNITADLDMTGITMPYYTDWNSYNVIFNGNNHTISNITKNGEKYCALFDRSVNMTLVAKDLTFKNCTFTVNDKDHAEAGASVFIGWNDVGIDASFSNIIVDSCTIGPIKYAGCLVGYTSASAPDSFTVSNVTFKNNVVSGYSAGTVIGHTYVDVNATGIKANNNTINVYLPSGKTSGYPGIYVGTINAGTFTLTATEQTGNNITATYGRTAGGTANITTP